jgi:septal ring factor EnvC (AmiA/AmiB activator)
MAVSKAAISNANSTGGSEFAPLQLKSAMEKMDRAERAMTDKNYELARQLAEQAQVDAQLAGLTARSAKAQKAVDALLEDNRVLRQEIDRKTK